MNDLRKILITKYDAIVAVKKYLDDENRIQGQEPIERHNRWRAEAILEDVPSIEAPEDWGRYSERLWQIAYDRGKEEEHRWWSAHCAKCTDTDRPQGEWVDAEIPFESGDTMPIQVCNLCKTFYPLAYTGGGHRFCPNCGARMLKGADDD